MPRILKVPPELLQLAWRRGGRWRSVSPAAATVWGGKGHSAIIPGSRRWLPKLGDGGRASTSTAAVSQPQCYREPALQNSTQWKAQPSPQRWSTAQNCYLYNIYRHLYIYTLRRLKRVLSIYNIALHTNQYCKPRVGEDEILERIFYCDEALGETAQRGCGCFILASVQGPAGCGFEWYNLESSGMCPCPW